MSEQMARPDAAVTAVTFANGRTARLARAIGRGHPPELLAQLNIPAPRLISDLLAPAERVGQGRVSGPGCRVPHRCWAAGCQCLGGWVPQAGKFTKSGVATTTRRLRPLGFMVQSFSTWAWTSKQTTRSLRPSGDQVGL
jgi:hypothetical protein